MRIAAILVLCACSGSDHGAQPSRPTLPPIADAGAPAPPALHERWAATFIVGADLRDAVIVFDGTAATFSVGDKQLPLGEVVNTPEKLAFAIDKEHYELARKGDTAQGGGNAGPVRVAVKMVKLREDEPPRSAFPRPQTPKPPFPYAERELVIDVPDGKLAGTVTIPAGTGPFPAVVLLSGSGPQDRDETIFGHKPFAIVADRLTRAGFVTYRFDDRGTGKTVGASVSLDTEIADAGAIVDLMKKQKEIDPKRIGLVGHSVGGIVAPFAAQKHPVAFIALLAGVTASGREYSAYQTEHALRAMGADDKQIAEQRELQAKLTTAALKGPKEAEAVLTALVTPKIEKALGRKPTPDEVKQAIAKPLAEATNPWTVSYFKLDPRTVWKKLNVPVLLLVGDKDTQVPADTTIQWLNEATGKRANVTAVKLPALNHLFQHAQSGEVDEYLAIEESFDTGALDLLTNWLTATAKVKTP